MYGRGAFGRKSGLMRQNGVNPQSLALVPPAALF
jgi:hypothetical protein